MIDALLYAVRDACRSRKGYMDAAHCEIVADQDGQPPARCGDWFLAIHQGAYRSVMDNALDEYFGFNVTLTMRSDVPVDRMGDQLLAKKIAAAPGPGGSPSFNQRANFLGAYLHMNWSVIGNANNYLIQLLPEAETVYGFSEPGRFKGMEVPMFVGGVWFASEPGGDEDVLGLKATLRFEDCRRGPQAIAAFS